MIGLVAVAAAVCTAEPYVQDLNCNGVDVTEEVPVDLTDATCAATVNWRDVPYPNADYYYDYNSYGCLVPVAHLDVDEDGLSAGDVSLMPDETFPDLVVGLVCDNCAEIYNPDQYDTDCDGVGDECDVCPEVYDPDQTDADQDGIGDFCDLCYLVPDVPQEDFDGDWWGDACDNCPDVSNTQADDDEDGIGDECDNCWQDANVDQLDHDLDGLGDACDVCPYVDDPEQADADDDGAGDACDLCPNMLGNQDDLDGDGVGDACDVCPAIPDLDQKDSDLDERGDACDSCPRNFDPQFLDTDLDGVGDLCDDCPDVYDPLQVDEDGDGKGDACQACLGAGWDAGECADYAARGGASTCGSPVAPGLALVVLAFALARRRLAVVPLLAGCGFIPAAEREWRLDPDGDGAEWPDDCDSNDPNLGAGDPWFEDGDGDLYGTGEPTIACATPGVGWVRLGEDCDDADATLHPGATELCDGRDNDCDGDPDEGLPLFEVFVDADGDGHGGESAGEVCLLTEGYALTDGDCDDADATSRPFAAEVCDEADNDCDGEIDEGLTATWWPDTDADGYGDPAGETEVCNPGDGWVLNGEDCDDTDKYTSPAELEVCDDAADNDCNGVVDDTKDWYYDADGDGFGDPATWRNVCDGDFYEVHIGLDCDDQNASANPALPETCDDGVDNDCDGVVDCPEGQ
ncbi:MAG: putative metal-binding motif-containing protein [Myxococcota bacterium]